MNHMNLFIDELNKLAQKRRTPLIMLFELTGCCNLDCKMCYVHYIDHVQAKKEELSTQQWKAIFDDAIAAGMLFATLSGGECLLRKDFKELYLYLFDRGIRISINTNGILLNNDVISFLKKYPPASIQISLYGSSDEEYAIATGVPAFSLLQKNLDALEQSEINFSIAITPSAVSKSFTKRIIEFTNLRKYRIKIAQLYISPREDVANAPAQLSCEDICSFLEYAAFLKGRKLKSIPIDELPEAGTKGEKIAEKYHCTAGVSRAQIDWRGRMHPCVALPSISCSLLDHSYSEAWKLICDEVDRLAYPDKCSACCYKNICKPCYVARGVPENYSECNEQNCEFVRMKISHGLAKYELQNKE